MELAKRITFQYSEAWHMLSDAIDACDDAAWRNTGDTSFNIARLAYHTIETVDYYFHDDLQAFKWAERFGVDWEAEDPSMLPGQEGILDYLDQVRDKAANWIERVGSEGLLEPDTVFHKEGMSHLDRALYVLRHTHHHIGEIFGLLRQQGIPRPGWR